MKTYEVFYVKHNWSQEKFIKKLEQTLNEKINQGFELVDMSYSAHGFACYITMKR